MSVSNEQEEMWEKLSTVDDPFPNCLQDDLMPLVSLSVRVKLQKYLDLSADEVDNLIDGYESRKRQ